MAALKPWRRELLEELMDTGARRIMVMGDSDSGKTTLVEKLGGRFSEDAEIGIVDADIGQSHLGPPATVAWGRLKGGFSGWDRIPVEDFYFTGAVSPPGNLLQLLTGTRLMVDRASEDCARVVIDTTGLVTGAIGRVLKQQKIDILEPDFIIALDRDGELSHILDTFRRQRWPLVRTLPVHEGAKAKSFDKRTAYRLERFRNYFADASIVELSLDGIGLRYTRNEISLSSERLPDKLVSLRDGANNDVALGILKAADLKENTITIKTPFKHSSRVRTVLIGAIDVSL